MPEIASHNTVSGCFQGNGAEPDQNGGEMHARCARGNICGQDKNIRQQFGSRADITADSLAAAQGDERETRPDKLNLVQDLESSRDY